MSNNWFSSGKKPATETQGPWTPTQDPLKQILGDSSLLYNQNKNKSTLAPLNATTKSALDQTQALAKSGVPNLNALFGTQKSMLANGGMTTGMQQAADLLHGFASGNEVNDPNFQKVLDSRRSEATNSLATRFGGGRYGSAAMGTGFAKGMDAADSELLYNNNQAAKNRQLQAQGVLGQLYSTGADNMETWGSMTPAFNEMRYDGPTRLASIGDFYQSRAQSQYDSPFDRLAQFSGYVNPIAGLGKTTTATKASPSLAQGILGGAVSGNALLGPWGALAGGVLGAFS